MAVFFTILSKALYKGGGPYIPFAAPTDVQLNCDNRIPVSIFGDDFVIDFTKIYDYISFIYDLEE